MDDAVGRAIADYLSDPGKNSLENLDRALLEGAFFVPVSGEVKKQTPGQFDVPVICIRLDDGTGAVPAFTEVDKLRFWKQEGCKYTTLMGRSLIAMARGMREIDGIAINPMGAPRGFIPRSDFSRMLALPHGSH